MKKNQVILKVRVSLRVSGKGEGRQMLACRLEQTLMQLTQRGLIRNTPKATSHQLTLARSSFILALPHPIPVTRLLHQRHKGHLPTSDDLHEMPQVLYHFY